MERTGYWDTYYAEQRTTRRPLPSQFATFVAGELDRPHDVVELGCGAGRDSIFFATNGHRVTGVDASVQAVESCSARAQALGEDVTFRAAAIDDPTLADQIGPAEGPRVVYARFFLHAITDEEEQAFFTLTKALTTPGDLLAVEYRTVRDSSGSKVTDTHYRRFVNPSHVQARALDLGFDVTYAVEGFGFAKYKQDDAYVARTIFTRL